MKKIIAYLCIVSIMLIICPSCRTGQNGLPMTNTQSSYQKKNLAKFGKKKKHKKDGSKYHPAVRKADR
jgi:hypothetical protein